MIICTKILDASLFRWKGKEGTGFASDLGPYPFCHVYDDACDEGFGVMFNDQMIVFAVNLTKHDREELIGWELISISESGYKITLFND